LLAGQEGADAALLVVDAFFVAVLAVVVLMRGMVTDMVAVWSLTPVVVINSKVVENFVERVTLERVLLGQDLIDEAEGVTATEPPTRDGVDPVDPLEPKTAF